jgi:hypothetical protein
MKSNFHTLFFLKDSKIQLHKQQKIKTGTEHKFVQAGNQLHTTTGKIATPLASGIPADNST